ncbi:hypothetical protein VNI00_002952 [Paramarasmius palmivorus]|uniref:Uncharacterized protein n=1 Tax=Paramarasmius palmivorus TaxID=297713 RepID=A0AAW0DYV6_9AGAR
MGFFKRILSIGSKSSKKNKKKRSEIVHNVPVDEVGCRPEAPREDDTEVAVNLLLRSSSTRYAVVAEMDCTSLPPLRESRLLTNDNVLDTVSLIAHPIDNVLNTPGASTTSLASTSISRKGTYNVKVHPREQRNRTDSGPQDALATPRAPKRDIDSAAESSQFIRLRRDPSVASLLDLYDEHGNLPAKAFSDSPTKEGRAQTKRSGSTLRQLLGEPSSHHDPDSSNGEGDISWAERYLGEGSSMASSASSLILQTPDNFDAHFPNNHLLNDHRNDITFSTDHDLSSSLIENPAISSMEVELSVNSEASHVDVSHINKTPYQHDHHDPKTPRRASQIFGFLTERRRSRAPEDCDRSLPDLPSAFSSPSDKDSTEGPLRSRFSTDLSSEFACIPSSVIPATPIPHSIPDTPGHHRKPAISFDVYEPAPSRETRPSSYVSSRAPSPFDLASIHGADDNGRSQPTVTVSQAPEADNTDPELAKARKVKVIMTLPTKVIVTAPTPSNNPEHNRPPTRIPRGPRSVKKRRSNASLKEHRATLLDRSNSVAATTDPITPITISHPRKLHRTSSSSSVLSHDTTKCPSPRKDKRSVLKEYVQKENNLGLSVKPDLPFTPIRSNSSRALFRTAVTPAAFRPPPGMAPSPASSSELSPVGKQMMMDARKQKAMMREQERAREGRKKSTRK